MPPKLPSASQTPAASSLASKKRKSSPQPKFYGVRSGHKPGVYLNWKDCEKNITGFKGASFKSFPTQDEARAYVAGKELTPSSTLRSPQVERFYGVKVGRIPGVYTDWTTAQEQIVGWKGPKYKKFNTRAEAEEFVRGSSTTTSGLQSAISTDVDDVSNDELVAEAPAAKRAKQSSSGNGRTTKRAEFEEDEVEDDSINVIVPAPAVKPQGTNVLRIHTDGSSLGNGKQGARAGLGVYFGPGDSRNVAERLPGEVQTNQRGELAAILRALEISSTSQDVEIVSDSQYSINCLTVWYKSWERNGWVSSVKQPVMNKDLIQATLAKIKDREALGTATRFIWVKGHAKDPGNEAADRLAVEGAQKPFVG